MKIPFFALGGHPFKAEGLLDAMATVFFLLAIASYFLLLARIRRNAKQALLLCCKVILRAYCTAVSRPQ